MLFGKDIFSSIVSGQKTLPNIWLQFPLPVSNAHYFFPTELIILFF